MRRAVSDHFENFLAHLLFASCSDSDGVSMAQLLRHSTSNENRFDDAWGVWCCAKKLKMKTPTNALNGFAVVLHVHFHARSQNNCEARL
mmetsp:Transcript_90487/g.142918  ORF Transcript_90487/g.142918 Transcript_90487/m.142918 type:complete len:89 (-) Transcript_90487:231-497(-)